MFFDAPIPFAEAISKLAARGIVPSPATTEDWSQIAVDLRERSFFSARVESTRVLQSMRDYLDEHLRVTRFAPTSQGPGALVAQGRAEFVADMRVLAIREGLGRIDPETGEIDPNISESDLTDIRSIRRLELVFDTQIDAAQEYGYYEQGQDPDILYAFPAQRFIRVRPVIAPRPYHQAALGTIRRKDDQKFWISLNRDFGVPWGPWGFGSGCGTEDVDRDEAIEVGAISVTDNVLPVALPFNTGLSAGVRDLSGDIAAALARSVGGSLAKGIWTLSK